MNIQLTFWSEEPPVSHSQSQGYAKALKTPEATSCSPILQWLNNLNPSGLSGKMSPVSCHLTEEKILEPSSQRWGKSGMGSHTESWTLNTSEWPKDAAVCSLLDTLEIGNVPQRFFLSQKACQGILRRAERRGKKLPHTLLVALKETMENQDI